MRTVEDNPVTSTKTVLVVDDNRAIREHVCKAFLADPFVLCAQAENGKEAIEVARKLKPDVIILDVSMPVMNGIQAAPVLKRLLPKTTIILFTLFGDQLKATDLVPIGISAVFFKDEPLDKLLLKALELMRQH